MNQSAFSLVELSIVLVILGLLTGGILGGQNLMKAAELRSVTQEFQNHQMAVNTFKDKYFALPGDMRNATDFWGNADTGTAGGECSSSETDTGTGTQTCNGNGNGAIGIYNAAERYEGHRFWQHLANAGLIIGDYTGVAGSGGVLHVVPGENSPTSKYSNAGWTMTHYDNYVGDSEMHAMDYNNLLQIGATSPSDITWYQAFSPEDVWNIDTKVDDGKPGTGKVIIEWWNLCSTAANKDDLTGEYLLSGQGKLCSIIFPNVF